MAGATTWCVVYNGGEVAQVIDDEGLTVYPASFACARRSLIRDMAEEGALRIVDMDEITDASSPASRMAKQEAQRRNDAIDADKADEDVTAAETPEAKTTTTRKRNG